MRYSDRRKARQKSARHQGNLYFAVAFVGLVVLGGLFAYFKSTQEGINEAGDLCPTKTGPRGYWAIILDTSDSLSDTQRLWVQRYIDEVLTTDLPKFYQVSLYSTSSFGVGGATPTVQICNPGDGSDKSIWISNPRKMKQKFEDSFLEPVNNWLNKELESKEAAESPLMRYIADASVTGFPIRNRDVDMRMVIISDMLENTPEYSQYRDSADFSQIKDRAFHARLAPHLAGVEVHLIYIKRPGAEAIQKQAHVNFWRDFIQFHGGRLVLVDPI